MRNFDKSEPFCCGRKTGSLCLNFGVSSLVLTIGLGLGLGAVVPEAAQAAVCFLPDCARKFEKIEGGNINTARCKGMGYTYYETGQCPQYHVQDVCPFDSHYLKCNAEQWCKNNGYTITSCTIPQYVDTQCPNGKAFYKQCKTDNPRGCRDTGYVNSCSSGRLYATSNRCPYDSSYGKCCTAAASSGCPSNYSVSCDPSRGSSGVDKCGYTCYRCCSDTCPSGSKSYSGAYASTTECGSTCRYCKDCTVGSRSYSGSYAGSSECGSCYNCSDSCSSGSKSVSCSSPTYYKSRVGSTECGTSCYSCVYNTDCNASSKSCTYGCASYNSCNKCTSCKGNPDCDVTPKSCTDGCASYNSCNKCTSCHTHNYTCPSGYSTSCSANPCTTTSKTCSCGATSGTCYKHTHSYSCPSGYSTFCSANPCTTTSKTCSCGAISGTCYKHTHEYYCPDGYVGRRLDCPSGLLGATTPRICNCGATTGICHECISKAGDKNPMM